MLTQPVPSRQKAEHAASVQEYQPLIALSLLPVLAAASKNTHQTAANSFSGGFCPNPRNFQHHQHLWCPHCPKLCRWALTTVVPGHLWTSQGNKKTEGTGLLSHCFSLLQVMLEDLISVLSSPPAFHWKLRVVLDVCTSTPFPASQCSNASAFFCATETLINLSLALAS